MKDTVAAHSLDVVVGCLSKHDLETLIAPLADINTVRDQVDRPTAWSLGVLSCLPRAISWLQLSRVPRTGSSLLL